MSQFSAELAGPLLLAFLLNWFLFGVLSVQVYLYWTVFPTGNLAAQMLVCSIYILETAQTISLSSDAFQTFVYGFTNAAAVDHNHNLWLDTYIYDGLVAFLVQTYFAHRIHVLLFRTKLLPAIIVLLSTTQFAGAIGAGLGVKGFHTSLAMEKSRLFRAFGAIVADILIAVTMIYALSRYDTTFRETRNFVRRLKRLAMETGSVTATIALVVPLLFFLPRPKLSSHSGYNHRKTIFEFTISSFQQSNPDLWYKGLKEYSSKGGEWPESEGPKSKHSHSIINLPKEGHANGTLGAEYIS